MKAVMLIESKLQVLKCCPHEAAIPELTYLVIENHTRRRSRVAVSIQIDPDGKKVPLRVYVNGKDLIRAVKNAMNHTGRKR